MSTEFYNRNWRMPRNANSNKVSNYSMSFDGSSEFIDTGIESNNFLISGGSFFSLSIWLNPSTNNSLNGFFTVRAAGSTNLITMFLNGGMVHITTDSLISGSTNSLDLRTNTTLPLNSWTHVCVVFDGTQSTPETRLKVYINKVLETSFSSAPTGNNQNLPLYPGYGTFVNYIGRVFNPIYFNGKIDHVAIFDYALSSSQVTSLYGNSTDGVGNPMAITKPVSYYKIGDKAAFNGTEYLVTNSASEVYSPYAFDFDGTNDYIDLGTGTSLPTGADAYTISLWVNTNSQTKIPMFFRGQLGANKMILIAYKPNNIVVAHFGNDNNFPFTLTNGVWYNIVLVHSATATELYVNSVSQGSFTTGSLALTDASTFIGKYGFSGYDFWDGKISNVSIWNTALTSTQVTEIYNQGKPSNLNSHSAYSNLVSWWQLGENSSFNTNWTVLDEKGTNNGTSVNMTEADLVNGVSTSGNGLSSGMGGADNIVGQAPYSTANAISYNMDVDAKSTSVPS